MRALVFDEFGPAEVLHVADVEQPTPAAGQIRIAVKAAAVNPVDWKIRSGASRAFHDVRFPAITGMDAAGTIDAVGEGVTGVEVGDSVFGSTVGGATAEYALLEHFAAKPAAMDWMTAAALPSAAETGYRAVELVQVSSGDAVVINGVAGGVGLAAAQFAIARGARVVGTASAPRHDFLLSLGIIPVVYGDGLAAKIREAAPTVDRVVDVAGNGILPELIDLVSGDLAKIITVADPTAGDQGVFFTAGAEGRYWNALTSAAELWLEGKFEMPVSEVYSLAEGAAAHRASETGHVLGKIVVTIAD